VALGDQPLDLGVEVHKSMEKARNLGLSSLLDDLSMTDYFLLTVHLVMTYPGMKASIKAWRRKHGKAVD